MSVPRLSVVIPAYNEAARLPRTLDRVNDYLGRRETPYEIVVVDDGSRDGTAEVARAGGGPFLTLLAGEGNRGKGHAVRRGMLAARGERRLMTDADLSTPIEDLPRLEAALDLGDDIAIGSRAIAGANVLVHQPFYREAMGRVFNQLVRLIALPGLYDTQCGFKLFTAAAAEAAFGPSLLDGFSFDVEALYVARRRGLRIAEVPVTWRNDLASRVGFVRGGLAFLDLVTIRRNGWAGRYDGGRG
jgi:dolichyl-phosphate beta-glucosyltransferase